MSNELTEYYVSTIPGKIEMAQEIISILDSKKGIMKGKIFFHKLSGSAGSYGFDKLSDSAKNMELYFDNCSASDRITNKVEAIEMIEKIIIQMKGILENNG